MDNKDNIISELSPLDQIRHVEAEVVGKIAAARETVQQTVSEARSQVKELLTDARTEGRHRGQVRYKEIVSGAEEESRAIVAQAHNQANHLRQKGKQNMSAAVRKAVNFVINLEGDGEVT
jgi:vacuolar-type H+-ATPase subunit H